MTQPKLFISYAHGDRESTVKDFWTSLSLYLNRPQRQWAKWMDTEILIGQEWDRTINQALENGCNCCLLLISELFANSSYIMDKEWPKILKNNEERGILFFPVVFDHLEGGWAALPEGMSRLQTYWPSLADLYRPPPSHVANPDEMRQSYIEAKDTDSVRNRFLSRLASKMNDRFDEYLREQAIKSVPSPPVMSVSNGQFVTNATDEETFAKAMFGSFSYEKRYRDSSSKGVYFLRDIDSKLDERLSRNDWILVEGHPLAGKTRAVFEAIRRLMLTGQSVAVWPFKSPERTDQPLIPPIFPEANCRVVWIDDIDARFRDLLKKGYGTDEINHFLTRLADDGVIVAATTRTGPRYYDFRHRFGLDDHVWDKLEAFPITRLAGEEEIEFKEWYRASFGESLPDKFDHHPGSLFLNLETMGDRWRNMDKIAVDHSLIIDIERAKDIMRALHVFYVMEAYGQGGQFVEEDIRFYLRQKAEKRQTATSIGIAFGKVPLVYHLPGGEEWDSLVEFLSQDKFHLGFLRRKGEYLLTETAYLDYIVAPEGEKNIVQTIVESFAKEERVKLGLMVTSYNFGEVFRTNPPGNEMDVEKLARKLKPLGLEREITVWNQLLYLCPTFPLARLTVKLLRRAGLTPDVITYRVLLEKAKDDATALSVIELMQETGITPDLVVFNMLVAKVKDYSIARDVISEMKANGIQPDVGTYNRLITKSRNDATARSVVAEMKAAGIQPDIGTYNKLVAKAQDYASARAIIAEMKAAGIIPNVLTYLMLIRGVDDYANVRDLIAEMRADRIRPDNSIYNRLIERAQDYNTARAVIVEMRAAGIKPSISIYNRLIERAQDYSTARAVIVEMETAGVYPTISIYNRLIEKAQDYSTADAIFEEMKNSGIQPNVDTYNNLIAKTPDYATANAVISKMSAAEIQPDPGTYYRLIERVRDYSTARTVIAEMTAAGIHPGLSTYNTLIAISPDYTTARKVVADMKTAGLHPDVSIYDRLIERAQDYDTARTVVAEMKNDGIHPDLNTYIKLVERAQDYNTVRAITSEMKSVGIHPYTNIYNKLIFTSPDFLTACDVIEEMKAAGIPLSVGTFRALLTTANDFTTASNVVAELKNSEIRPTLNTYTMLFESAHSYETARAVITEMSSAEFQPDAATYSALFAKDLTLVNADELLAWYLNQPCQLDSPLDVAIKSYHQAGQLNDALLIALHYPELDAARELIIENEDPALEYFRAVVDDDPLSADGNYALGIALMNTKKELEAISYLETALSQDAIPDPDSPRAQHIEKLLLQLREDTQG